MSFSVTKIESDIHALPFLGEVEYLFCIEKNELTVNVNGVEVLHLKGDEAKAAYISVIDADLKERLKVV